MERSGRLLIMLGTVLVSSLAPSACQGQRQSVAPAAGADSSGAGGDYRRVIASTMSRVVSSARRRE